MLEWLNAPGVLSARSTMGSDLSYLFAAGFTSLFLISGRLAVMKKGKAHHWSILLSMTAMLGYFVFYYEVRRLGVQSLADQIDFHGPQWVYQKIFRPLMMVHFLAVSLSTFLALYMIANGFKTATTRNNRLVLKDRPIRPSLMLWGLGVFWLLFILWWAMLKHQFAMGHTAMFVVLGYALPAGVMLLINKLLPQAEHRHRTLGKLCLVMYAILLVTSTLVYYLLYIAF